MYEIRFASYGQKRDRNATEHELEVFEILRTYVEDDEVELVRKCDEYVTAEMRGWDLARIKFTPRAKWVMFPSVEVKQKKHYIEQPEDVRDFEDLIRASIETIKKFT